MERVFELRFRANFAIRFSRIYIYQTVTRRFVLPAGLEVAELVVLSVPDTECCGVLRRVVADCVYHGRTSANSRGTSAYAYVSGVTFLAVSDNGSGRSMCESRYTVWFWRSNTWYASFHSKLGPRYNLFVCVFTGQAYGHFDET